MNISVDSHEADKLLKKLKKIKDFTKPMTQSGQYMEGAIGKRFKNNNWAPLAESTMRIHPRRVGGRPLLDTGKLRASVTSQAVTHVSKKKLSYGTNLNYAPMHNFGGRTSWGTTIPQREFLYFDEKDEKMIMRIFHDYAKELTR